MTNHLTRRSMLARSSTIASLFCLGDLRLATASSIRESHELQLAAAATLEFYMQRFVLPNVEEGVVKASQPATVRNELYEVSKLLKPDNAPQVFRKACVQSDGQRIDVVFSNEVSIHFSTSTVRQLKAFIDNWNTWRRPTHRIASRTKDVVNAFEKLLDDFSNAEAYNDD